MLLYLLTFSESKPCKVTFLKLASGRCSGPINVFRGARKNKKRLFLTKSQRSPQHQTNKVCFSFFVWQKNLVFVKKMVYFPSRDKLLSWEILQQKSNSKKWRKSAQNDKHVLSQSSICEHPHISKLSWVFNHKSNKVSKPSPKLMFTELTWKLMKM